MRTLSYRFTNSASLIGCNFSLLHHSIPLNSNTAGGRPFLQSYPTTPQRSPLFQPSRTQINQHYQHYLFEKWLPNHHRSHLQCLHLCMLAHSRPVDVAKIKLQTLPTRWTQYLTRCHRFSQVISPIVMMYEMLDAELMTARENGAAQEARRNWNSCERRMQKEKDLLESRWVQKNVALNGKKMPAGRQTKDAKKKKIDWEALPCRSLVLYENRLNYT